MLEIDWSKGTGWHAPVIRYETDVFLHSCVDSVDRPYGKLELDPAASVFHYALECFEGMKAYVDTKGQIRLFRPELNMKRMNTSMKRLFLPVG